MGWVRFNGEVEDEDEMSNPQKRRARRWLKIRNLEFKKDRFDSQII